MNPKGAMDRNPFSGEAMPLAARQLSSAEHRAQASPQIPELATDGFTMFPRTGWRGRARRDPGPARPTQHQGGQQPLLLRRAPDQASVQPGRRVTGLRSPDHRPARAGHRRKPTSKTRSSSCPHRPVNGARPSEAEVGHVVPLLRQRQPGVLAWLIHISCGLATQFGRAGRP